MGINAVLGGMTSGQMIDIYCDFMDGACVLLQQSRSRNF